MGGSYEAHVQGRGTENANLCGENNSCMCDKGFISVHEKCVSGKIQGCIVL